VVLEAGPLDQVGDVELDPSLDIVRRKRGEGLLGAARLVDAVDHVEKSHRGQHAMSFGGSAAVPRRFRGGSAACRPMVRAESATPCRALCDRVSVGDDGDDGEDGEYRALDVLHILTSNSRRGAETFAFELHNAMLADGTRSAAVALSPRDGADLLPVPVLGDSRFSVAGLRALRRRARGVNVIVAHGSSTLLACGAGLAGLGVPFVYVNIGDPRYWAGTPAKRARVRFLLHRATAVAAISHGSRQILVDDFGLPLHRVRVIPNGRRAAAFPPVDAAGQARARRELGLPAHGDLLAMIGALSPEKRVDVAIEALATLPDVRLAVAGAGPERDALAALAERRAPGRVTFLGSTDRPATVLAAADALVLSSDSEGVPGALIEAGLAALPAVATDVGWVREVVVDGVTGHLVPPADPSALAVAVRSALTDRDQLGAAARSHCLGAFELETVVARWKALLDSVAEEERGRRRSR
jgi:glycosyltransferase involved in cell wall biosynthesis